MTLKDMIQADSQAVFLNTGEFAESVAYGALGATSRRSIKAVVFREGLAESETSGGEVTPTFVVHVDNDTVTGIASSEINLGGDVIDIPARPGEAAAQRRIIAILDQDEGMMVLQCL